MDYSSQRTSPRKLICIPVLFAKQGTKTYLLDYSTDLSNGGVLIQTTSPLPVGTRVDLKFRLPNALKLIEVSGEVVWSLPYIPGQSDLNLIPGMGVKFSKLDESSKIYIESFVRSEREKQDEAENTINDLLKAGGT